MRQQNRTTWSYTRDAHSPITQIFHVACVIWIIGIVVILIMFAPTNERMQTRAVETSFLQSITNLSMENLSAESLFFDMAEADLEIVIEPQPVYELTDYERWLVESIVAGESGNQPYWGKVAVASCIFNACIKDELRPAEVQDIYGYAGWYDIDKYEASNPELAQEVRDAVSQVFDRGEVYSSEILWFYNPDYGYSSFHNSQTLVAIIGDHMFFKPAY